MTGLNRVKTAVFISGTGSNLKNLIKYSQIKKSPISINLIISNTNKARGLHYGDLFHIKKKILNFKNIKNAEKKLLTLLMMNKIELICLAGFMKILSKGFIKKFNGKIINIHPSLLPKYKGLNTHNRAIQNRDNFSGIFFKIFVIGNFLISIFWKLRVFNFFISILLVDKILLLPK